MNESDSFSNFTNQIDENAIHNILDVGINQVTLQSNTKRFKTNTNTSTFRTMKNELASIQNNINRLEQKLFSSTAYQSFPSESIEQSKSSLNPSIDYKQKLATKENEIIDIKSSLDEQLKTSDELKKQIDKNSRVIQEKNMIIQNQTEKIIQLKGYKEEGDKLKKDYDVLLREYNKSEEIRKEQKMIIKELQRDIDNMRQESLNRINLMKYQKDLIDIKNNQNNMNSDNIYTNRIHKTRNKTKSKSPSNKTNINEKKKQKGDKHKKS